MVFLPSLMNYCVYRKLETELPFQISGNFYPFFSRPGFSLTQAKLNWQDRIQIDSGNLRVGYSIPELLKGKGHRIEVEGSHLNAELLGSWAELQGVRKAEIKSLKADVLLKEGEVREIFDVSVLSPAFQFNLKRTEK